MAKPLTLGFPVSFEEAIAWAEARGVALPEIYKTLPADLRKQTFTIAGYASADQLQRILTSLNDALKQGETFADWQQRAGTDVQLLGPRHQETVFRNATQNAYNAGRWKQFQRQRGRRPFLMFDAIMDARTSPVCRAHDGLIRSIDDPIWSTASPQLHHNCFLPGITVRGDFEIGLKSCYSGPAVEIVTDSGFRLSVTINHPVLTRRGWIQAGCLNEGDNLLCCQSWGNSLIRGVVDNQNPPIFVEQVFETLARDAMGIVEMAAFDFHSDMEFRKGDVDVAGSKCVLMNGFKPTVGQRVQNWNFVRATADTITFKDLCGANPDKIFVDDILSVRKFSFSGHVYDFQTQNGLILANGIITQNCRSTLISLTPEQAQQRSGGRAGLNQPLPEQQPDAGWGQRPTLPLTPFPPGWLDERLETLPAAVQNRLRLQQALLPLEQELADEAIERSVVLARNGDEVLRAAGDTQKVGFTADELDRLRGQIVIHNHPVITSFSGEDIEFLVKNELTELRAVDRQWVYVMRPAGAWTDELKAQVQTAFAQIESQVWGEFMDRLRRGQLTPPQFDAELYHVICERLAMETGLIYTRTRRVA